MHCKFQLVKLAVGSLLGFGDKLNRNNEFVFVWNFAMDKCAMVDEVLDFHADGV